MIPKPREQRLRRAAKLKVQRAQHGDADTSNMSPADQVLHAMRRHGLRALLQDLGPMKIDHGLRVSVVEAMAGLATPRESDPEPPPKPEPSPAILSPDAPTPWYEELSHWRKPGEPARYDESEFLEEDGLPPYGECIHEYDPLAECDLDDDE
jgi:hypothetical protein